MTSKINKEKSFLYDLYYFYSTINIKDKNADIHIFDLMKITYIKVNIVNEKKSSKKKTSY